MAVEDAPEKTKPSSDAKSVEELKDMVARAWLHAGVNTDCELCGHGLWTVLADDKFDGLALIMREGQDVNIPGQTFMVYGVECRNCGHIRQFNKATMESLAAQYRAPEADTGADKDQSDE